MIPQARPRHPARMFKRIPPEFHPYMRRVAIMIVLAATAGVVLALVVPAGHH
jgi:hypothetical protein